MYYLRRGTLGAFAPSWPWHRSEAISRNPKGAGGRETRSRPPAFFGRQNES